MSSCLSERAWTSWIGCFYWSQADDVIAALVHLKELSLQFSHSQPNAAFSYLTPQVHSVQLSCPHPSHATLRVMLTWSKTARIGLVWAMQRETAGCRHAKPFSFVMKVCLLFISGNSTNDKYVLGLQTSLLFDWDIPLITPSAFTDSNPDMCSRFISPFPFCLCNI